MKKYFSYILTLIVWAVGYYVYLPPLNLKSTELWSFLVFMAVTGLFINAYRLLVQIDPRNFRQSVSNGTRGVKIIVKAAVVFVAVYLVGQAISLPVFRAKDYGSLINVTNGNFEEDVEEADFTQIPILDSNKT